MTLEEAKIIASEFINSDYNNPYNVLVLVDEETIEKDYGWYFVSVSKRYLKTDNISDIVAGNGPVLVDKGTGNVIRFGTAYSLEESIESYEKENT